MSRKLSNWVDRFDPIETTLDRILAHAFAVEPGDSRLAPHVLSVLGMVDADATEVQVARFVRGLHTEFSQRPPPPTLAENLAAAILRAP